MYLDPVEIELWRRSLLNALKMPGRPRRRPNIIPIERWVLVRQKAARRKRAPECPKIRLRRAAAAWIEEFGDCPPLASCSSPPAPTTAAATDSAVATACAAATAGEAATAGAAAPRPVRLTKRKEERCETRRSIMRDLETIILKLKSLGTELTLTNCSK